MKTYNVQRWSFVYQEWNLIAPIKAKSAKAAIAKVRAIARTEQYPVQKGEKLRAVAAR